MTATRASEVTTPDRGRATQQARSSRDSKIKTSAESYYSPMTPSRTPGRSRALSDLEKSARKTERENAKMQQLMAPLEVDEETNAPDDDEELQTVNTEEEVDTDVDVGMKLEPAVPDVYVPLPPRADRKPNGGITTAGAVPRIFSKQGDVPNNGRHKGRQLIRWNAAADQLLLLTIQYECYKHGLHIPWDAIARRFANEKGPPTAQCMIQHLSKLRGHMLDSGRWVPPLMGRQQQRVMNDNGDVRGNVRYLRKGVAEVRDVDWDEDLSHLINPMEIQPLPPTRFVGGRKLYESPDGQMTTTSTSGSGTRYTPGSATRVLRGTPKSAIRSASRKKSTSAIKLEAGETDDVDSDGEYNPSGKKAPRRALPSRRARSNARTKLEMLTDEGESIGSDKDSENDHESSSEHLSIAKRRELEIAQAAFDSDEERERDQFLANAPTKIVKLKAGPRLINFQQEASIYYNESDAQGFANDSFEENDHVENDPFVNKSPAPVAVDEAGSTTPFDIFASDAKATNKIQVSLIKPDGTAYQKHFARVIMNFNTGKFDASTATELWEQAVEDHGHGRNPFKHANGGSTPDAMPPKQETDGNKSFFSIQGTQGDDGNSLIVYGGGNEPTVSGTEFATFGSNEGMLDYGDHHNGTAQYAGGFSVADGEPHGDY